MIASALFVICSIKVASTNTIVQDDVVTDGNNQHLMASTYQLGELLKQEIHFVHELKSYLALLQKEAESLNTHLEAYYTKGFDIEAIRDVEDHIAHPINALGVIKRTSTIGRYLEETKDIEEKRVQLRNLTQTFPPLEDYFAAASSIALIQEAYSQETHEMSSGVLKFHNEPFEAVYKMDTMDLLNIGLGAANRMWFDNAVEWIEKSVDTIVENTSTDVAKAAKNNLAELTAYHDKVLDRKGPNSIDYRTFSVPFDAKLLKKKKYREAKKKASKRVAKHQSLLPIFEASKSQSISHIPYDYRWNFMNLCEKGSRAWREPFRDTKLRCRFQHHGDPYVKLGPFKIEELSEDPYIVSFPGFMSDGEIDQLKSMAANRLSMSLLIKDQSNSDVRTSKQAWVNDKIFIEVNGTTITRLRKKRPYYTIAPDTPYNPIIYRAGTNDLVTTRLDSRISLATQFMTLGPYSSEAYQVANYGLGGQYSLHHDPLDLYNNGWQKDSDATMGDRLATFMMYLSDVKAGGDTAFPLIGLSSRPQKGTAILWINTLSFGNTDKLTVHGGCPVLVGSKWISNKWIRDYDQMMKFPCTLGKWESYGMFEKFRHQNLSLTGFKVRLD